MTVISGGFAQANGKHTERKPRAKQQAGRSRALPEA
jgi:hypothetical protein